MKVSLAELVTVLSKYPEVANHLDIDRCITFLELVQLLKPTILLSHPLVGTEPPERLPVSVHEFLKATLGLEHESTKIIWNALSGIAWKLEIDAQDKQVFSHRYIRSFLDHGLSNGLGVL